MGRNDAKMDYDTIFDLYGINRDSLSVNEERTSPISYKMVKGLFEISRLSRNHAFV